MMVKKKDKVLVFIDWFYPAYKAGGPIKSVFTLATQLKAEFEFYVVSSNQDVDAEILTVMPDTWQDYKGVNVIYIAKNNRNKSTYKNIFSSIEPDLIYYNSIFSYRFTILPYLLFKKSNVMQMIAPRGMLGKGALSIKPLKKKLFLWLARHLFLENDSTFWHATSEQEAKEIKAALGHKITVRIAKNLSSGIFSREKVVKNIGELKLVFVSRISEKKNLLFILRLLDSLKNEMKITLHVYGPIEDENYWNQCNSIIERNSAIQYEGILKPDEIVNTLQKYHFFILPTLHENYGHSIIEALQAGVPVLISDQTPWLNIAPKKIGADIELDDEKWRHALTYFYEMDNSGYNELIASCYKFSEENITTESVINNNKALFLSD